MERSIQDETYSPHTVALTLIVGIAVGVLGSRFGWFAPVHEWSHVLVALPLGGQVTGMGWDWVDITNIPSGTARLRAVVAAGAVGEHLAMVALMIVALLRARPLLSGAGFGYLAHGMDYAWSLSEWQHLRQPFFVFWEIATYLVYILLATVAFTYVSWVVHVACISRSKRSTVPRHSLARHSI